MRKQSGKRIVGILVGILFLVGCSGPPLKVDPIARTENPTALMEKLGQDISAAQARRADLFSPTWFALAQSSYEKARAGIDKGTQLSAILENIAAGQAQLRQARLFADKSRNALAEVIESRDAAQAAGADQYEKDFAKLEVDFLKLTRAIEDEDSGYVHNKKKAVNDAYRALELRAIKDAALGDVRRLMTTAQSQKMDRAAPKSFLIAKSKLADADAVITRDRYAGDKIAQAVRQAGFYVQRMNQIAQTSVQFDRATPEDIVLKMENYFAQTLTRLKAPDSRNLPFDAQQKVVMDAIADLERNQASAYSMAEARNLEIKKLKQRVADQEGRTYQERVDKERIVADKERLAAEKRFNELYNQVQGYFSNDEAEVYKKGRELVIRLKAMRFPVGRAVIVPDNYPLLTTVQKAIDTFDKPDVVIEGHTDSTGSVLLNQQLSQKRAESVQQYFVHNGTLPANRIAAIGYGSSRPLASNETVQGRAINRRIDVIIKPVQK